ncbi:transporter, anaerobic C4-dicarboxylate uptake C family [gut metagenome]|uniref:Transporter, anaerobic C4-dicarboxylate uptake C family n=1 Tax=gut metagenome TaxID=749906 RepID=J9GWT9_9ZZZZ
MVKPLGRLGIFLLPFCMLIASCVAIAIPSAAGCAAALGPTMIPLMVRAGFKPAIAGAAIIGSIIPSSLSPGSSHNVWVAKISNMEVMDLIVQFAPKILTLCALNILLVTAMVFVFRDYKKTKNGEESESLEIASDARGDLPEHPNILMALRPHPSDHHSLPRGHCAAGSQDVDCRSHDLRRHLHVPCLPSRSSRSHQGILQRHG